MRLSCFPTLGYAVSQRRIPRPLYSSLVANRLVSPRSATLKRVSDSRAVQFWDKSRLIAAQLKQQFTVIRSARR